MLDALNTGSLTSEDEPSVANSPRIARKNRLGSFSGTAGTPGEGPNGVLITDSPGERPSARCTENLQSRANAL